MNSITTADQQWHNDFIVGLRLRDASPALIADQLKIVQTHCSESRESAAEAFGDPTAYAAVVAAEGGLADRGAGHELVRLLPAAAGGFLAARCTFDGLMGVVTGEGVSVHAGDVGAAVLIVVGAFVLLRLIRAGRPAVTYAVAAFLLVAATLLDVAGTPLLVTFPAWIALVVGLLGVGCLAVATARSARREQLIDPVDGTPLR